jgi:hypothetical protein
MGCAVIFSAEPAQPPDILTLHRAPFLCRCCGSHIASFSLQLLMLCDWHCRAYPLEHCLEFDGVTESNNGYMFS